VGVVGQHHAQAAIPLGQTQYPFYRMLGGPKGQSGWAWKICPHRYSKPRPSSP